MANIIIDDLPLTQIVNDDDVLIVSDGNTTYKAKKSTIANSKPFSFVGMVVQGTNLTDLLSVQAIYGDDTTWQLISDVILVSRNVFGNGKVMGLTSGSNNLGLSADGGDDTAYSTNAFGKNLPFQQSGITTLTSGTGVGLLTKALAGNTPDNSGIIVDTVAVYSWERIA